MTQQAPQLERVYPPKLMFMVANPIMKFLIGAGIFKDPGLALLTFEGRKTGKTYKLITAVHEVDGRLALATNSGWRHNFAGGRSVLVKRGGVEAPMVGTLEADPEKVADVYGVLVERFGSEDSSKRLGIGIPEGAEASHEALTELADRVGMGIIWLTEPGEDAPQS